MSIESRLPAAPASPVVEGATSFAFDLYDQLKAAPGNLFFSPYSISTCLAMTCAGARGETEKQMAGALHLEGDPAQVHAAFGQLQQQSASAGKQKGVELNVANALWAQQGHPFLPAFLNIARKDYQANVNQADFKTASAAVIRQVNDWVAERTKDKIKEILPAGSVDAQTRLVLANAIYFKGLWATPFPPGATLSAPFHLGPGSDVKASLMHRTGTMRYMEGDAYQAVEVPYSGNQLALVILLPRAVDGLNKLEGDLSPAFLSATLTGLKEQPVDLFVPSFEMSSSFALGNVLKTLGMADAFGPAADFSGMDGARDLFISHVFHKAWVEMNEKGTEAAAATATVMTRHAIARPLTPPVVFRADHPFVFLIRDTQSDAVLFLGRLANSGK